MIHPRAAGEESYWIDATKTTGRRNFIGFQYSDSASQNDHWSLHRVQWYFIAYQTHKKEDWSSDGTDRYKITITVSVHCFLSSVGCMFGKQRCSAALCRISFYSHEGLSSFASQKMNGNVQCVHGSRILPSILYDISPVNANKCARLWVDAALSQRPYLLILTLVSRKVACWLFQTFL